MASVTTNYGFDVPTSSDLVKNGATAISTLGQDIDTFLFRPFGVNAILNSSFQVWQRGTSITPSTNGGAYTADRWFVTRGSNTSVTASRQVTGDTTNLPNIQYCARVQRTASSTTTSDVSFGQMFETIDSVPFAGKTVVLSGYIRKGANFSATSDLLTMQIVTGTGTDQKQMDGGYTGSAVSVTGNVTLTSTWQRFSVTGTIPTSTTEITPKFFYAPTGTAGANDYFEITGVQLEVGSQATPFHTYAGTIQGELAACQRYYQQYAGGLGVPYNGVANSSTTLMTYLAIQPTMRTAATCTVGGTLYADDGYSGTVNAASPTVDFVDQYQGGGRFRIGGFSGMTTGRHYSFYYNTGYIGLSAEL